ncbi:MAG: hypothetical protein K2X27_08340 [Candidatus Obscuribacterales bacterium]|nr:hypothetical protein [Candidatus Obscuribacterales bacterium]
MSEQEAEKIKLKVAGDEIKLKAGQSSATSSLPSNLDRSRTLSSRKRKNKSKLPALAFYGFGMLLFMLAAIGGPVIERNHLAVLANIDQALNSPSQMDSKLTYIKSLYPGHWDRLAPLQELVSETQSRFGPDDPRTAFAHLAYANALYDTESLSIAESQWRIAVSSLENAKANVPAGTTQLLWNLGSGYLDRDNPKAALVLLKQCVKFSDLAPCSEAKPRIMAWLAEAYERNQDYKNAAAVMLESLKQSRCWGNTEGNACRAAYCCRYLRKLNDYEGSLSYGKEAVKYAIDTGLPENNHFRELAERELALTEEAIAQSPSKARNE